MKSFRFVRMMFVLFLAAALLLTTQWQFQTVKAQSGRKPKRPDPVQPSSKSASTEENKKGGTELRLPSASQTKPAVKTTSTSSTTAPAATADDVQDDPSAVIKVETTLISLPVSVLDRSGRYVPFLRVQEFHVFEDSVEQEIVEFRAVNTPFHVVLLLDTSGSTAFRLEDIQNAAIKFTEQLGPEDKLMVISFDSSVDIETEFTTDRAVMRQAIRQTKTGGSTRLYDAVEATLTERLSQIEGRKAVVLFTDGVDTSSRATGQSTIRAAEEANAVIYPIKYNTDDNRPYPVGGTGGTIGTINIPGWPGAGRPPVGGNQGDYSYAGPYLRKLAEATGGRMYNADTLASLDSAFARIAEELRHQYLISYYPTNTAEDGGWRTLKVRVDQPDLIVRARLGYRAKGGVVAEDNKKKKRPTLQTRKKKQADTQPSNEKTPPQKLRNDSIAGTTMQK